MSCGFPGKGSADPLRRRLNEVEEQGEILTSALVVGELIYGAECSARREEKRENVRRKLERIRIVPARRSNCGWLRNAQSAAAGPWTSEG